jgi:hypothetical protein
MFRRGKAGGRNREEGKIPVLSCEGACMLTDITEKAVADDHASSLLCRARECAEIYLLVTKRRKGCDGMGELAMIKEEFREALDGLLGHCIEKGYLPGDIDRDIDRAARELCAIRP